MSMLNKIPATYQGALFFAAGLVLLLHTLGFFTTGLRMFLIIGALYLIIDGLYRMDAYSKMLRLIKKR